VERFGLKGGEVWTQRWRDLDNKWRDLDRNPQGGIENGGVENSRVNL